MICLDVMYKRLKILSDIGYILLLQKEYRSHQNRQLQYWIFLAMFEELFKIYQDIF